MGTSFRYQFRGRISRTSFREEFGVELQGCVSGKGVGNVFRGQISGTSFEDQFRDEFRGRVSGTKFGDKFRGRVWGTSFGDKSRVQLSKDKSRGQVSGTISWTSLRDRFGTSLLDEFRGRL